MGLYRQGDVLFVEVDEPAPGVTVAPIRGEVILALGEVTGHHHAVKESESILIDNGMERFLYTKVISRVTHEEHSTITLPAGKYFKVLIQHEYTPVAIQRVID